MSVIPRNVHFVFGLKPQTRPFHLVHYLCLESCLRVNRPERLLFHCHHEPWGEYWDLIRDRVTIVRIPRPKIRLRYKDRRTEIYRYAHESDFVRMDALLTHGGVYADMDTLFVNPIPPVLFEKPFVLCREGDVQCQETGIVRESLCNAFIMSPPQSEFGRLWRNGMESAFDGSWSRHSTFLPCNLAQEHPGLIHIEPSHTFYPYMWTPADFRRLFEGCEEVDAGVSSIHLWAHLWWSEKRRDFSDVHNGLFTESRIRTVDTTYNLLARPFLPDTARPARRAVRRLADAAGCAKGCVHEALVRLRRRAPTGPEISAP